MTTREGLMGRFAAIVLCALVAGCAAPRVTYLDVTSQYEHGRCPDHPPKDSDRIQDSVPVECSSKDSTGKFQTISTPYLPPLAPGQIVYSLPTTKLSVQSQIGASAPSEESSAAQATTQKAKCDVLNMGACFSGVKLAEESIASDKTWLITPKGGSLLHGATKLVSVPQNVEEPRLPKTISVVWTNTAENAAVAGGVAFTGLVSFGVVPAVVGAGVAVIAQTSGEPGRAKVLKECETLDGKPCPTTPVKPAPRNSVLPPPPPTAPVEALCGNRKSDDAAPWHRQGVTVDNSIAPPPDRAEVIVAAKVLVPPDPLSKCWNILAYPPSDDPHSADAPESGKPTGWLYRIHDVGALATGFQRGIDLSTLHEDAIPVAPCRRISIQFTWYQPAETPLRSAANIEAGEPPYIRLPDVEVASEDATYIRLPSNGDINFGQFCGAYGGSKVAGGIGDTLSAAFKSVGDSETAAAKAATSSSGK